MKIIIELNKNTNPITEIYESLDLINVFGSICSIIDNENIATFSIVLENGEKISPMMDFAYDFTSIMPELCETVNFLKQDIIFSYKLYLYELDITIYFEKIDNEYVTFCLYDNATKRIEYNISQYDLLENIEEVLLKFKDIVFYFFPIAYNLFVKENYLGFAK